MGFIKEDDSKYPASVKQIEPGDSVIGGPNGPINICLKNLTDRTGFLKKDLDKSIEDIGKKANQSDLITVKNTADNALKNSSNNAVNINDINKRLNDADIGMKSSVLNIDDFDNVPEINQSYTIATSAIKNGPFSGGFTGTIQVLKRFYGGGDELIIWAHAGGKTYKRVRVGGTWGLWSFILENIDISHEGNGTSKEKVASEYALGLVNAKVDGIKIPTASTSAAGIVKLNSSTNSASTTEAATPSAVKSAYDLASGRATKEYVDNAVKGIDLSVLVAKDSLIGVPMPYPSNTPPTGFIAMVGQSISQSQYPKLFALYGSKLPDMRDRYIRGANGTRGGNPLTLQDDAIRNITGTFGNSLLAEIKEAGEVEDFSGVFFKSSIGSNYKGSTSGARPSWKGNFDASRVVPTANENRPYSITFNYICLAG